MPACWKFEAMASAVPQQKPPSQSRLRPARFSASVGCGRSLRVAFSTAMSTSSASTAMKYRTALNVNVPIVSAQTSCATKAVPQMSAARIGKTT